MKTIRVDADVFDHLNAIALPGETAGDALRRNIGGHVIEVDDNTYSELIARSEEFGESASDVIRRVLNLSVPLAPDGPIVFRIPAGTGDGPWNTQAAPVHGRVGQTLRIVNDDAVGHRLHTAGEPFAHPAQAIAPGHSDDFLLSAPFEGALYDHEHGPTAEFWLDVTAD